MASSRDSRISSAEKRRRWPLSVLLAAGIAACSGASNGYSAFSNSGPDGTIGNSSGSSSGGPGFSSSSSGGSEDASDTCVSTCSSDQQCQSSCTAAPSGSTNCCDLSSGTCVLLQTSTCPDLSDANPD